MPCAPIKSAFCRAPGQSSSMGTLEGFAPPFGSPPATFSPLASPFGDFGTCTFPTTPARYARALALGLAIPLPRWYAASGEGAREARGGGRVAGGPEVPAGGAGGSPARLVFGDQPYDESPKGLHLDGLHVGGVALPFGDQQFG